MCVFLGHAVNFFFGPSLGVGGVRPPRLPVDPPLCRPISSGRFQCLLERAFESALSENNTRIKEQDPR